MANGTRSPGAGTVPADCGVHWEVRQRRAEEQSRVLLCRDVTQFAKKVVAVPDIDRDHRAQSVHHLLWPDKALQDGQNCTNPQEEMSLELNSEQVIDEHRLQEQEGGAQSSRHLQRPDRPQGQGDRHSQHDQVQDSAHIRLRPANRHNGDRRPQPGPGICKRTGGANRGVANEGASILVRRPWKHGRRAHDADD